MNLFYWMLMCLNLDLGIISSFSHLCMYSCMEAYCHINFPDCRVFGGQCEKHIPLSWGICRSSFWLDSDRAQPWYLRIFCRLLLFLDWCGNEWKKRDWRMMLHMVTFIILFCLSLLSFYLLQFLVTKICMCDSVSIQLQLWNTMYHDTDI